jgi:hypothetical protein
LHRWFRRVSGRLEQALLELAAFNWQGRRSGGFAKSRAKLKKCLYGKEWNRTPYFAPGGWRGLAPDRAALDAPASIVTSFDRLDRSALHGVTTRLDFVHRIHLSHDAEKDLETLHVELLDLMKTQPSWEAVRDVALRAAEVMAKETASWQDQVRREKDGVIV